MRCLFFIFAALLFFGGSLSVSADTALTVSQVNALTTLLQSFGVDNGVVSSVNESLLRHDEMSMVEAVEDAHGALCQPSSLSRNLAFGNIGEDVRALQVFLNTNGSPLADVGAGSRGNETDYFGLRTYTALVSWQEQNSITPASGFFGPLTRDAVVNKCAIIKNEAEAFSVSGETATTTVSTVPSIATTTASTATATTTPALATTTPTVPDVIIGGGGGGGGGGGCWRRRARRGCSD